MKIKFLIPIMMFIALGCSSAQEEKTTSAEAISFENVQLDSDKDPVCGMSVKKHVKDTTLYQGKVYGFCNVGCKKSFNDKPEDYLK